MVRDAEGHLILLTDHVANNVIVYDNRGRLVSKWDSVTGSAWLVACDREGARGPLHHGPADA